MKLRDDWLFRGLVHQTTDDGVLDRLSRAASRPTSVSTRRRRRCTSGNLLQLCTLRRLQLAGNRPIALAGGGTGLIGDPSFKAVERPLLTLEAARDQPRGHSRAVGAVPRLLAERRLDPGAAAEQRRLAHDDLADRLPARRGQALHRESDDRQGHREEPTRPRRRGALLHGVLLHAAAGLRLLAPATSITAARCSSAGPTSGATSRSAPNSCARSAGHTAVRGHDAAVAARRRHEVRQVRGGQSTSGSTPP